MPRVYKKIDELIGRTPTVRLENIEKECKAYGHLYAKLEYFNPTGSCKDRAAYYMIKEAEQSGVLKAGATVIEPTSGNTGIGLAAICASRGYRCIIVMPDSMSEERRRLMRAYGAELVLTPGALGMTAAIERAQELARTIPNAIVAGQFDNSANPKAHKETTGPELYCDMEGKIDIFVAGIGTGGTLSGTAEYLKEQDPNIKTVGVEPASSPYITRGVSGAHKIQGIGAGFVPGNFNAEICDEVMTVTDADALEYGRLIARREGYLVGISSGAALAAAISLAKLPENKGKNIVALLPDSGDRYLSSEMFAD